MIAIGLEILNQFLQRVAVVLDLRHHPVQRVVAAVAFIGKVIDLGLLRKTGVFEAGVIAQETFGDLLDRLTACRGTDLRYIDR